MTESDRDSSQMMSDFAPDSSQMMNDFAPVGDGAGANRLTAKGGGRSAGWSDRSPGNRWFPDRKSLFGVALIFLPDGLGLWHGDCVPLGWPASLGEAASVSGLFAAGVARQVCPRDATACSVHLFPFSLFPFSAFNRGTQWLPLPVWLCSVGQTPFGNPLRRHPHEEEITP